MTDTLKHLINQLNGGYNYKLDSTIYDIRNTKSVDVSVIIPVRGRIEFHNVFVKHINAAFENSGKTFSITFVEHSNTPEHWILAKENNSNYIYIKSDDNPFNKCLAFNMGFLSNKASHYLFHDLDCMMQSNFIFGLYANLQLYGTALQSFRDRRVLYCDQNLTDNILADNIFVNSLHTKAPGVKEPEKISWKAPGGSIFCSYDQFLNIGGFDPEYFFGYSIEDGFFYNKLEITCGINSCNNPEIELFHLNHPPLCDTNPHLSEHHKIYDLWMSLSLDEKTELMKIKSTNLKKYI